MPVFDIDYWHDDFAVSYIRLSLIGFNSKVYQVLIPQEQY